MDSTVRRVLFVAPSAYCLSGLAGWLDVVLPGLGSRGWDARLGLVAGPRHHRPEAYLRAHPCPQSVIIPCRSGTERGRRNAVRRVVRSLRPHLVCSVNIPDAISAVAELRAEGKSDARAVMTCHGIQADLFEDMRGLANSTDAVICTNRLACDLAAQAVRSGVFVGYAPYGVSLPGRCRLREAGAPFTLAYVGRFEEDQKRISEVVGICRELREKGTEFRLLIAGGGPDEAWFREQLCDAVPGERLEWLGHVPSTELSQKVYARADVLLLTSVWETGPIVAWEAMAHGVVLVSARYVGSGREAALIHGENALLFDIGAVDTAAELIRGLAVDGALWNRLSRSGRELVSQRYSVEQSVTAWHGVLSAILEQPARTVAAPPLKPIRSRLSQLVGTACAEHLRGLRRSLPPDSGPAGEWPHTLSGAPLDNEFWNRAAQLDRAAVGAAAEAGS